MRGRTPETWGRIAAVLAMLAAGPAMAGQQVYTIPLGPADRMAEIFPTDVVDIDRDTGRKTITWPRDQLHETIATYMMKSLTRDGLADAATADPQVIEDDGILSFRFTADEEGADKIAYYTETFPVFLGESVLGQGMAGAAACQEVGPGCWNPVGEEQGSYWRFYPPLGLPFASQKTVLLTHYPPYRSMVAGDYLHNPTMTRWNRVLRSVGVEAGTEALYENTVDANPIAAPGAGQGSYFFPVLLASAYFDAPNVGRDYIRSMLSLMTQPPATRAANAALPMDQRLTIPVLVVGGQSRQLWANKFPAQARRIHEGIPTMDPNMHGLVSLSGEDGPRTPYMTANHPDVALLMGSASCPAHPEPGSYLTEGIVAVERSDLAVACYAYEMGRPGADPAEVAETCNTRWLGELTKERARMVCANGLLDASHYRGTCTWDEALDWCGRNDNQLCQNQTYWPSCTLGKNG